MSNLCRRFRTTCDRHRAKLLIRLASAAVAEGRQQRRIADGRAPSQRFVAAVIRHSCNFGMSTEDPCSRDEREASGRSAARKPNKKRPNTPRANHFTLRTVAHFPHYIGRRGSLILRPKI